MNRPENHPQVNGLRYAKKGDFEFKWDGENNLLKVNGETYKAEFPFIKKRAMTIWVEPSMPISVDPNIDRIQFRELCEFITETFYERIKFLESIDSIMWAVVEDIREHQGLSDDNKLSFTVDLPIQVHEEHMDFISYFGTKFDNIERLEEEFPYTYSAEHKFSHIVFDVTYLNKELSIS